MFKYFKITISIIFYIASVIFFNYDNYINIKEKEIERLDDKLKIAANAVYLLLENDFFYKATDKDSISLEEDWENIHKLTAYNNHANLSFIYSSIKKDNKIYLTCSSASEEELKNKTEVHYFYDYNTAGKGLRNAFNTKQIVTENYTDKWGSFRAVHIPLTLENSHTIVVSAEISLTQVEDMLKMIQLKYITEALLYIFLTIPIVLTFFLLNKEAANKNLTHEKILLQQSRLAQMGEVISMIAHQWRQPLNTISAIIQTIIDKYNSDKLDDKIMNKFKVDTIAQVKYLSDTLEEFREFFKPERDKEDFYISEVISHVMVLFNPIIEDENIKLYTKCDKDIIIHGFPKELGQVLLNLLNNSYDALAQKNIKEKWIELSTTIIEDKVVISIYDNGGGIDEKVIHKVFDPYFSTKAEKNGTGLGMYMSKLIIEDHMEGDIKIENKESGLLVTITL